ncbi:hypothetical protein EDX97_01705 [Absicoccus porci]|uniref:Uncharacterized protein n=1 Tax=Absicoccus porci TaxID=2486576 RepID=A0A3N0I2Z8_9FIRM|nr:hypothetical protein [Absicoccus porci]RNM31297.1 hypothetical protein EDX97_01705 [Absicoccus porci]
MQDVLMRYILISLFLLIVWIVSLVFVITRGIDIKKPFFQTHKEGITIITGIVWNGIFVILFMSLIVPTILDLSYMHAHAYPMITGKIAQIEDKQVTIQGDEERITLDMDIKNHKVGDIVQVQYLPNLHKGIEIVR